MSHWIPVIRHARGSLFILACATALGGGLIYGSSYFDESLFGTFAQHRNQSKAKRAGLAEKQQQLAYLEAHIEQFRAIEAQGLLGVADREEWVQQLLASRKQLGLPDTLVYTLKQPAPMTGGSSAGQSGTPAAPVSGLAARISRQPAAAPKTEAPMMHDLEIELRDIHEEELLALLQDFQSRIRNRFRVQSCQLTTPVASGLSAQCTLRFFSLPQIQNQQPAAGRTAAPSTH